MPVSQQTLYMTPFQVNGSWLFRSDGVYPDPEGTPYVPEYYLPASLTWISWDAPLIGHTGIDLDYKMTGYDWFNRELVWSLVSPPAGATIDADGTLHWTPSVEAEQAFTVRMTVGGANYDKTFTCDVDNSRCVFVATTGNDSTGDGTVGNPYLTLYEAFEDVGVSSTTGTVNKLIIVRGGSYTIENTSWSGQSPNTPYRKISQANWDEATPLYLKGYPTELPVFNFTGTSSGFTFGGGVSVQNFELVGGGDAVARNASDGACINSRGKSALKRLIARDYNPPYGGNPTGVLAGGGCILDRVTAYDNYDRDAPTFHNSSNYLFFGTAGTAGDECFVIDCVSAGHSAQGFKIKHAGSESNIHLHRCVSYGTYNPYAGADNGSSVRHSLMYKDSTLGASSSGSYLFGFSVTDPTSNGNNNLGVGMLCDTVFLVSDNLDTEALAQADYVGNSGSDTPCYYTNVVAQLARTTDESYFSIYKYATPDAGWTAVFKDNEFISSAITSPVRFGSGGGGLYPLSWMDGFGENNTTTTTRRDVTVDYAGSTWFYDESEKTLYRDDVAVSGDLA